MPTATHPLQKRSTARRKVARPRRPRRTSKPLRMSSPEAQRTLIDEIDDRQEVLLNDLASLNARVEALLDKCLASREEQRRAEDEIDGPSSLAGPNVLISQSPSAASAPQEC